MIINFTIRNSNINVVGGFKQRLGPGGNLICPSCGWQVQHQRRLPCFNVKCQRCGTNMIREQPVNIPAVFSRNYNKSDWQNNFVKSTPPIQLNAMLRHEYRGVCITCHQILDKIK